MSTIVIFIDKKIEDAYEKLKTGNKDDKKLYKFITRAIEDIKEDIECGTRKS